MTSWRRSARVRMSSQKILPSCRPLESSSCKQIHTTRMVIVSNFQFWNVGHRCVFCFATCSARSALSRMWIRMVLSRAVSHCVPRIVLQGVI